MTEHEQETGTGQETGPKLRGWQIAAAAAAVFVVIAAGAAAMTLLVRPARIPAGGTPARAFPTFALATPTDTPQPTPTLTGKPPDVSEIAGAWCIPKVPAQSGVVVEVIDGETLRVRLDADGSVARVRYAGIDAPPMAPAGQFMAPEALAINAGLVDGKRVELVRDTSDADKDGTLPRYVVADGVFVNLELVMQGAARAVSSGPDMACFLTFEQAEQQATAAGRGLWSRSGLTPFPTSGIAAYCDCRGRDLDCKDFASWAQAQSCFRYCKALGFGDVFHLDNDGNGYVCPGKP